MLKVRQVLPVELAETKRGGRVAELRASFEERRRLARAGRGHSRAFNVESREGEECSDLTPLHAAFEDEHSPTEQHSLARLASFDALAVAAPPQGEETLATTTSLLHKGCAKIALQRLGISLEHFSVRALEKQGFHANLPRERAEPGAHIVKGE